MAEINLRTLFDRIPVYGETGFAKAAYDSQNIKNKNSALRLRGGDTGYPDRRPFVLAADRAPRKSFRYSF